LPSAKATPKTIHFIENDYPKALAEARSTHRPLFIDAWAPWCHTCLSMRAYVFDEPKMKELANEFVWLAMDTEAKTGDAFIAKYPMNNWPTLWVVDPDHETPLLKWIGSATSDELARLLDPVKSLNAPSKDMGEAEMILVRADRASAKGDVDAAIVSYREAIAKSAENWVDRPRALEALSSRLWEKHDYAGERDLAVNEVPKMPPGTSRLNVTANGIDGASHLSSKDPANDRAMRALLDQGEAIAKDRDASVLADDRSSLYEAIVEAREGLGDHDRAVKVARAWAAFLEGEAARATNNEGRSVFDAHRVDAYLAMGEPTRALPMLAASAHDFPRDYNTPVREARVLAATKKYDEALAAIDRAFTLVYGPRTLRLYVVKADILKAKGDRASLARTIDQGLAAAKTMPLTTAATHDVDALEKLRRSAP
jgi:tetratricopeptide (TPR) repeat protein/thiol-disulfide isomerase/thioredoxin